MKKTYIKPQILFSSFELSESISAGCETISNHDQGSACPVTTQVSIPEWGNVTFFDPSNNCDYSYPDVNDQLCYHAPVDTYSIHTS